MATSGASPRRRRRRVTRPRAERNAASSGVARAATHTACAYIIATATLASCANRHARSRREPCARSVAAATNAKPRAGKTSTTVPGPGASVLVTAVDTRALGDHDHAERAASRSSSEMATRKSSPPRMTCTRTAASATCAPSTLGTSTSRRRRRSMKAKDASGRLASGCGFGPTPPECIRCPSSSVPRMHGAKTPRAAVAPRRRVSARTPARIFAARISSIYLCKERRAKSTRPERGRARGGVDRGAGAGARA